MDLCLCMYLDKSYENLLQDGSNIWSLNCVADLETVSSLEKQDFIFISQER